MVLSAMGKGHSNGQVGDAELNESEEIDEGSIIPRWSQNRENFDAPGISLADTWLLARRLAVHRLL